MQKYSKEPYKYQPNLDEKMNGDGNTFSHQGCLMTAVAKIASEVSGKEIDPYLDVNQKIDKNKDGKLSVDEISYMLCLLSRKKSRKDHSAIYQLLYSWIMNMFIP